MATASSQELEPLSPGLPRPGEVLRLDCRWQTGTTTADAAERRGLRVVTVRLQPDR